MADPELLAKLKEGVTKWNEWRREHPNVVPDLEAGSFAMADLNQANLDNAKLSRAVLDDARLSLASLAAADLSGASLVGSDITAAFLSAADIRGADLRWADIRGSNLVGAILTGADLRGTQFSDADLSGAQLTSANLRGANLERAKLTSSDFTEAVVANTLFCDNDLSRVKGLDTVHHFGPSTIGIDTIYRSEGNIPDKFLRGAGVPDDFITYMGSLTGRALEFYSCFISYSSKDDAFTAELHTKLQAQHVRCWKDSEELRIGDRFQEEIERAIKLYDKLLVVLSANSVNSQWVEREVQAALEREQRQGSTVLFPVRLDDAVMDCPRAWAADIRRTRHIGDFRNWKDHDSFQKSLDRLLRDLKSRDSKSK